LSVWLFWIALTWLSVQKRQLKKVIDVYQGKTPHFLSNKNSQNLVKDLNTRVITFGWLTVPGDLLQSKLSQNPSLMPLSKVKYISSFLIIKIPPTSMRSSFMPRRKII